MIRIVFSKLLGALRGRSLENEFDVEVETHLEM